MNDPHCSYRLKLRGGGSLVGCKPVFANDSSCSLLCGSGDQVKVFSNGECVRRLVGHTGKVTSIVLNPVNSLQVLTSSIDGSIIRWDWKYGGLLHRYNIENPVFAMYSSGEDRMFGLMGKDADNCSLVQFVIGKHSKDTIDTKVLIEKVDARQDHCDVGCQGNFVALIKLKTLTVYNKKTKEKKVMSTHRWHFTCVACHPQEYCIATGCVDGTIKLWRNFFESQMNVVKTVEHWHSLPVRSLAFSAEGSMLLSGGYECVLVKWPMPDLKKPDTLPRLGSPIINLACSQDSANFAVCYLDNGMQVIDNKFLIKHTFHGLVQGHFEQQVKQPIATGIHFDPRTGALVLNGRTGHLQFYDIKTEQQMFTLDIVGENYISPEDLKRPLFMTEVENMAFDSSGDWLATVERRDDGATAVMLHLKFWSYSKDSQIFTLNTNVRLPHYQRVTALKFRPKGYPMAVTSCPDGKFKLWTLMDVEDAHGSRSYWKCDSVGTYHNKIPGSLDFDEDGSLLAVAFEELLTLWEPDALQLVDLYPISTSNIRNIVFGHGKNSAILMFCTESMLYAWDVLLGYLLWTVSMKVQTIVANPKDDALVVFSKENLFLYNPSHSSQPVFSYDIKEREIVSAAFDMYSSKSSIETLYFITKQQELLSLVVDGNEDIEPDVEQVHLEQKIPLSKLHINTEKKPVSSISSAGFSHAQMFVKEIVNMPVSFMPLSTTLCEKYLSLLTKSQKPKHNNVDGDDDDDEDESQVGDQIHLEERESSDEEHARASIEDFADELMEIQD